VVNGDGASNERMDGWTMNSPYQKEATQTIWAYKQLQGRLNVLSSALLNTPASLDPIAASAIDCLGCAPPPARSASRGVGGRSAVPDGEVGGG
jgi:hypothetical protein